MKATFLDVAEIVDAWRVVPRLMMLWFMVEASQAMAWYRLLEKRESFDHLFVAGVLGIATAAFKFYVDTGRKWA